MDAPVPMPGSSEDGPSIPTSARVLLSGSSGSSASSSSRFRAHAAEFAPPSPSLAQVTSHKGKEPALPPSSPPPGGQPPPSDILIYRLQKLDRDFHKYQEMMSFKMDSFQRQVESRLDTLHVQVAGLQQELGQLVHVHSNPPPARHNRLEPNQAPASASGSTANIHLRFLNNWKPPIYTDKDITDENNLAIKVAMFQGDKKITSGPLSKAKIEILVLCGSFYYKFQDNWTEEEFDKHIVHGRDEKRLVLGTVWLNNGEVELSQIRFKESSFRKKFSMSARFCKSEEISGWIQEAIMEPEEVQDRRNESNKKSNSPSLDDPVYRIKVIARDGVYHKRLQKAKIYTAQDFLKALNKDPNGLLRILEMKNKGNSWSKMTGHARKRNLEDKDELKACQTEDGNVVLFFNCVYDLVGARFGGNYIPYEQFDTHHKSSVKRLKMHAYTRLDKIPYDYIMKGDAPEKISSGTGASAGPSVLPVEAGRPNSVAEHPEAYQGYQGTGASAGPSFVPVEAGRPTSVAEHPKAYQGYQGTGASVGPSVVPVELGRPNSVAEHPEAYQVKNWFLGDTNFVTQPILPSNTHVCQGTGASAGPSVVPVEAWRPNSVAEHTEAYQGYQGQGIPPLVVQHVVPPASIFPDWQGQVQVPADSPNPFELANTMVEHQDSGASSSYQPNFGL